jgi:hypothetical protein
LQRIARIDATAYCHLLPTTTLGRRRRGAFAMDSTQTDSLLDSVGAGPVSKHIDTAIELVMI